jgi:hypothetical protein
MQGRESHSELFRNYKQVINSNWLMCVSTRISVCISYTLIKWVQICYLRLYSNYCSYWFCINTTFTF